MHNELRLPTCDRITKHGYCDRPVGHDGPCFAWKRKRDVKVRLVEAYGGDANPHAEALAEAELRWQNATCSHIMCERSAYGEGGTLARGIPLCEEHAGTIPSSFDMMDVAAKAREIEQARIRREVEDMATVYDGGPLVEKERVLRIVRGEARDV